VKHQVEWLRRVASECQREGKTSWANTCEMVANDIAVHADEIARLKAEVKLHKAALRWVCEQGALDFSAAQNCIPPAFAPLIDEAVKP
jgi:hypothetical protein